MSNEPSTNAENAAPEDDANALLAMVRHDQGDRIRNLLVERFMPLVRAIARRECQRLGGCMDVDELISAGTLGLMDAIQGYDDSRGVKFETYCTIRIRGSMLDELRGRDWVPRLVRRNTTRLMEARRQLAVDLKREPSDAEVAEFLGLTPERLEEILRETSKPTTIVSLDVVRFADNGSPRGSSRLDAVADLHSEDPTESLDKADLLASVLRLVNRRERIVMLLYYQRGFTMRRIGTIFGMSESRVCQIHTQIIERLRDRLKRGRE